MGCTAWSHRSTDPHWRERNFNLLLTTHTNQNPFELNHLRNYRFPTQWIIFILKYSNLNTKNLWLYFLLILISQVFFDQYTIQLPTASHNHVTTSQFHLLTSATCLATHVQPHHSQGTKLPISLIYCQLHHCTIIEPWLILAHSINTFVYFWVIMFLIGGSPIHMMVLYFNNI